MLFPAEQPLSDALLLVVEAGNTTASFALFRGGECLEVYKSPSCSISAEEDVSAHVAPILTRYPALCDAAICSVVPTVGKLVSGYLRSHLSGAVVEVTASMPLPFVLNYDVPESFGADRIALCALSSRLYPEEAVIALDIGTAITVDVVSSGHEYFGGLIMPGLDLMARALHEHTARLPLAGINMPEQLIGRSTADCIRSGIVYGCVSSLDGLLVKIRNYLRLERNEQKIRVIATGGNAPLIAAMLESSPDIEEFAVLKGTHYLFMLNAHSSSD